MPKRLLDDSLLNSPSMAVLSPRAQDAFPRFVLLADDFGCFEVSPRVLLARGWPDRADVSERDVASWLDEYASRAPRGEPPSAILWEERARTWCHLTGWEGAHGQRKRAEYDPSTAAGRKGSKRRTPPPPTELLAAAMAGECRPPAKNSPEGQPENLNDSLPGREMRGNPPGEEDFPRTQFQFQSQFHLTSSGPAAPVAEEAEEVGLKKPRLVREPSDPRKAEKRAAFEALFLEIRKAPYEWQGAKDACAIKRLVAAPLDEWIRRAREGLTSTVYSRQASTVALLGMKWNDLAGVAPAPSGPRRVIADVGDFRKLENQTW